MDSDGMVVVGLIMGVLLLGLAIMLSVVAYHAIPSPFNWITFGAVAVYLVRKVIKAFKKK